MNIVIISYSYSGNNSAFAGCVAKKLSAEHIEVSLEKHTSLFGTVMMDMLFGRTPKVKPAPDLIKQYDLVLFAAPVWMGSAASPLRAYFNYLKEYPVPYGFLSVSGGADGGNSRLAEELLKRTGQKPVLLIDMGIADLLSARNGGAKRADTSTYKLTAEDAEWFGNRASEKIREIL